ncbi:MAG: M13 family metallopeptidase [Crocinitomicaceae bacterium]|nr:M13 family metallopeptidase [Crocinitomicaceae bacterium]
MKIAPISYLFLFLIILSILYSCSTHLKDDNPIIDKALSELQLEFEYMDTSINPRSDFYQYCNGTWMMENPVPDDKSKYSTFNVVDDKIKKHLRLILLDVSHNGDSEGSDEQILGDFYTSFMDTLNRNDKGTEPLDETKLLEYAASIENSDGIVNVLSYHHPRGINSIFNFRIDIDEKNNSQYVAYLSQGGLGLPNKGYYFDEDERSITIRADYKQHISNVFDWNGMSLSEEEVARIYGIEEALAEASRSQEENRDDNAKYNPYTVKEIANENPTINWPKYFDKIGLKNKSKIIVQQPEYFRRLSELIKEKPINDWSLYMQWRVLNEFETAMTTELLNENFDFYSKTMRGRTTMKKDWERAIATITGSPINELLGKKFVEVKFSIDDKAKVNEMVDHITAVFDERINDLDWMSEPTKNKAKEKLASFARKLGFPDKWKSYEDLQINDSNYLENIVQLSLYTFKDKLDKLNNAIDKSEWHMPPHLVNAYYNPVLNEIVFPAGIMQNPFFDARFEDAVNYARMGAVIGHELTHGFDDQGSRYGADGNLENWWTSEDSIKFSEKTQKLIEQYNEFEVLDGVFINGKLTLGENIADFGGLTIAYYAYLKSLEGTERSVINGFSNEQRFFIAFGQVWKNTIKEDELITRVKTDYHSPGKYRVNGTLSNMPEFFSAFNIQEGDAMRQPSDKITKIW